MIAVLAIPGVGPVLVSLLAALILYGSKYLAKFVSHIIPRSIPYIGGWIADRVEGLANSAINAISGFLDAAIHPLWTLIHHPIVVVKALFDAVDTAFSSTWQALHGIIFVRLPAVLAAARVYTLSKVNTLAHWVTARVAALIAAIANALAAAKFYALGLYHLGITYTLAKVNTLAHWATARIAAVISLAYTLTRAAEALAAAQLAKAVAALHAAITATETLARALYADTLGRIAATAVALEHYADAAAAAAAAESIAVLDAGVRLGLSDVWGKVVDEAAALEGVIATDFPDILAGIRDIDLSVPADVAAALAAVGALSIPMLRYMRECGIRNCRNLGGLGRDLQALLHLVDDAIFLALIVELVHNPAAAARELHDVTSGLVDTVMGEARGLFGVG